MSQTLKNIQEVIEQDTEYEQALIIRTKNLKKYTNLGPPDMCYLTKGYQKSLALSKKEPIGSYHYVYGINMNNPACMSTYIYNMLKQQEQESNWFSNGKWIITRGIFCVYDIFNKIDVRVEIKLPGGFKLYAINKDEEMIAIDENKWEETYISSVLRSLYPELIYIAVKVYKELSTYEAWVDFTKAIINLINNGKDLEYPSNECLVYRGNKIIHMIVNYLVNKKRFNIALEFVNKLVQIDPKYIAYMSDIFSSMNKLPETIKLISSILDKNPHIVNLLYIQAQNLMRCEQYEMALKLTKIVVQLSPDSFEAWLLLIEIYAYCKHYNEALIIMNMVPIYPSYGSNTPYLTQNPKNITKPKLRNTSDSYSTFMFEPNIENCKGSISRGVGGIGSASGANIAVGGGISDEISFLQADYQEHNEKAFYNIKNAPANNLNDNEKMLYKVLVRIEREIGWDKLLNIRSQIFLMEGDLNRTKQFTKHERLHSKKLEDYEIYNNNNNNSSIMLDESIINFVPGLSMNENSYYMVKAGGEKLILDHNNNNNNNNKILEDRDSDESNEDKTLPSFLQAEDDEVITPSVLKGNMKYLENAGYQSLKDWENQRPQKITEETEENIDTDHSDKLARLMKLSKKHGSEKRIFTSLVQTPDIKSIINFDTKRKRICSKLSDTLFGALYEDLTLLFAWQNEENFKKTTPDGKPEEIYDEKMKLNSTLWIYRGQLAERLCRNRYAERAYRKVVEKESNLYAWNRLYKMYMESGAIRAALICLAEILDEMENYGIKVFTVIPDWITLPIYQAIFQIGESCFQKLLQEMNWEDEALKLVLKDYQYWQVENWTNPSITYNSNDTNIVITTSQAEETKGPPEEPVAGGKRTASSLTNEVKAKARAYSQEQPTGLVKSKSQIG